MEIIFAAWAGILLDAFGFHWGLIITVAAGAAAAVEIGRGYGIFKR